jgi:UDP-N-acetylglucosamine 2-epimerase (non-hydrolysing)
MVKKIVLVLGIRPDVIRASIFINLMREYMGQNFILIWSGQHYSENLKDVFFRELGIEIPEIDLSIKGETDAELVSDLLPKLSKVLRDISPEAVIFLGDTNTVIGSIAAAQLNIPIVHIEGCMRSYDWRMPEEKYRKITDHLSDLVFAYLPEYKEQGLSEGIPSINIEVCGNPIVDVLETYFTSGKLRMSTSELELLKIEKYSVRNKEPFALMTCHRRENIENIESLKNILDLSSKVNMPILFPASYRTQKILKKNKLKLGSNIRIVDPIGYLEILELMYSSEFILSDSGTLIEEAAILGIPSIQMRHSTERPQVYKWGASIKFDPLSSTDPRKTLEKISMISKNSWVHEFGFGDSSFRIFESIRNKMENDDLSRHQPKLYAPWSIESYSQEF